MAVGLPKSHLLVFFSFEFLKGTWGTKNFFTWGIPPHFKKTTTGLVFFYAKFWRRRNDVYGSWQRGHFKGRVPVGDFIIGLILFPFQGKGFPRSFCFLRGNFVWMTKNLEKRKTLWEFLTPL